MAGGVLPLAHVLQTADTVDVDQHPKHLCTRARELEDEDVVASGGVEHRRHRGDNPRLLVALHRLEVEAHLLVIDHAQHHRPCCIAVAAHEDDIPKHLLRP